MPLFWFLAGVLSTLAALVVISPWLMPRVGPLPAVPRWVGVGALVLLAVVLGLYRWIGHPELAGHAGTEPPPAGAATRAATPDPAVQSKAGSMSSAIANLEARLAKGGGSDADWELLAKSYEFVDRPEDAKEAREHRLPPVSQAAPTGGFAAAAAMSAATGLSEMPRAAGGANASGATTGIAVIGEVTLAEPLRAQAASGSALFIVAKSVDRPGAPVAVFRGRVGEWPVRFRLDDSQSMLPGRNLSSAGRVTIEARISRSGQAMPASGDLLGTTGVIDPAAGQPLKIVIDHVI